MKGEIQPLGLDLEEAPPRRLLIVNPNSSVEVSRLIHKTALSVLADGVTIRVIQPDTGPMAIQTLADRRIAEPLALDLLAANADHDAYVMACFDDIALDQARRFLPVPVVGAVEASVALARLFAARFSVVTTVQSAIPGICSVLEGLGAASQCSVRAAGIGVTEAADGGATSEARIDAAIEMARNIDGAQAIILGSAGLTGRAAQLSRKHRIVVIDAMEAAVRLAVAAIGISARQSQMKARR
ncbi:MAG: aspartate/glutamate racemase family protein [Pseudotabrizicola sp.]|uniref:aspartate/glutamate racemase family protein n=1 Tax=Pseudotabrizicola sp. TaxID=2939647 RepID=UPI00271AAE12|nr:aspartate/glutamate racemase family protein [Pseudotabrizicola sp.]MDO8881649.1 aspartate/glutamate racemase family protein [Pseudotabrizicola sp.]MDP2079633.1 aspartate/glutamate racemase family protein [Pseudotabrizicola sp.]MDZ7574604.1 aspartate/glutamate racemase family protein [Pseudotabrizicola sp.]